MSGTDDIDELRREKLESMMQEGETDSSPAGTPNEPVYVSSQSELDEAVSKYETLLVEFYADWCGPCKMVEPVLEELARETEATIVKIDVDANQQLAAQYQVRGVPTMMIFSDGEVVHQFSGARDKQSLERLLDRYNT